jgi:hypothetical protein
VILASNAAVMLVGPVKVLGPSYAIPVAVAFLTSMAWVVQSLFVCFIYRYANMVKNRLTFLISNRRGAALAVVNGRLFFKMLFSVYCWTFINTSDNLLVFMYQCFKN